MPGIRGAGCLLLSALPRDGAFRRGSHRRSFALEAAGLLALGGARPAHGRLHRRRLRAPLDLRRAGHRGQRRHPRRALVTYASRERAADRARPRHRRHRRRPHRRDAGGRSGGGAADGRQLPGARARSTATRPASSSTPAPAPSSCARRTPRRSASSRTASNYSIPVSTANGAALAAPVVIDSLTVGADHRAQRARAHRPLGRAARQPARHELSGAARVLRGAGQPADLARPGERWLNTRHPGREGDPGSSDACHSSSVSAGGNHS